MFRSIRKASLLLSLIACVTFAGGIAALAADNTRYVSITGSNANACTLTAPCRSLQRGITVTPAGGELRVLDSGFFGNNATIRKSLTISGNGHTITLGNSIVVDNAEAVVALRGLVLDGQNAILNGISITAAASVHIERCVVHGFFTTGILATADGAEVFIVDSILRNNHTGFNGHTGTLRVMFDNSHFDNNKNTGISIASGQAVIQRSTASGNGNNGIAVTNGATATVVSTVTAHNASAGLAAFPSTSLSVESSLAYGNAFGVFAQLAVVRISGSSFIENGTGVHNASATVETRQNNTVRGNTTNVSGALTPIGGV